MEEKPKIIEIESVEEPEKIIEIEPIIYYDDTPTLELPLEDKANEDEADDDATRCWGVTC